MGFPILRDHTFESTLWIMTRGITLELEAELAADVVLVDRPVPDALGYLVAALRYRRETLSPQLQRYLDTLVMSHSNTYSRILLTTIDPQIPIDTTKERDTDPEFRRMAADGIAQVFQRLSLPFAPLPSQAREAVIDTIVAEITTARGRE